MSTMAEMKVKGLDEYIDKLEKLGSKMPEVAKKAVKAGVNPLADEVRKQLEKNLRGSEYSTGDLIDSLGITPVDEDKNGVYNAKVGFSGYDRKGVPNALKARAMESGTSRQRKKPFMRPAVNRARKKVLAEMGRSIDADLRIYSND
ncbi:MAG: HK97-gp10 family putative phage morphogenesis protein [Bacteroidales bacterium]